jgi:hypothetical protein
LFRSIKSETVRLVKNGRCGEIRYYDGTRYAALYYERPGDPEFDFLVWFADMKRWSDGAPITNEERATIRTAIEDWARRRRKSIEW